MASASTPIEIRGRYFWKGDERVCHHFHSVSREPVLTEEHFMIRGVVYQDYEQPPPVDAIADDRLSQLRHDIELFRELGLNAIFVCQYALIKRYFGPY